MSRLRSLESGLLSLESLCIALLHTSDHLFEEGKKLLLQALTMHLPSRHGEKRRCLVTRRTIHSVNRRVEYVVSSRAKTSKYECSVGTTKYETTARQWYLQRTWITVFHHRLMGHAIRDRESVARLCSTRAEGFFVGSLAMAFWAMVTADSFTGSVSRTNLERLPHVNAPCLDQQREGLRIHYDDMSSE
ncbi:hypothetical protein KP509_13G020100 [Ceratopteris richardii]|uniref:Uncharacterized protein n=1 Tax=Ceratopteris richardii TaxID=49495 RepID=A0A8T2TBX8_CERRI|nr:hypothetical protein KP509_13G020100 [Ceratopteris richardii]